MSDGPVLWDRVTGVLAPVPRGLVALGRYQIPPGEYGNAISGVAAPPGTYLAAGGDRWTLRRGTERWAGWFGTAPTPSSTLMGSVAAIARRATDTSRGNAPLSAWTEIPPLDIEVKERLRRRPLENHLRIELQHLRAVCHQPHARLRTEYTLVPVSQARRITWRTVVHLANHSETWAARRLHGVEPARLLTPVRVPDHDLYENRVVATLLDRLWRHVQGWIADVDSVDDVMKQAQEMTEQASESLYYREKGRLYTFIGEFLTDDDLFDRIERRRKELVALREALARLLNSELCTQVWGPYTGPSRLRPTNLFDNEVRYRHCRQLWDAEVVSRQDDNGAEPVQMLAAWCRDFTHYALVLILRGLDQLGLTPTGTEGPQIDQPGPAYIYRGHTVRLDWNHDDTFTLLLDDERVLRLVPLAHALTERPDRTELDQHLKALQAVSRVAVLYPSERSQRNALPLDDHLAVHTSTLRAGAPLMVPISPTDLRSVGRVARALRGALDEPIMLDYPARVSCRLVGAEDLPAHFDWLVWRDGHLLVTRPPAAHEMANLGPTLARLRIRGDAARQQADNEGELNRLHAALCRAVDRMTALLCCPIYLSHGPSGEFIARANATYRCRCPHCATVWEIRQCSSCQRRYPVLIVDSLARHPGGNGDLLDERFSQDLLAVPCWLNSRDYVCSFCGHCPEAARGACERCQLKAQS